MRYAILLATILLALAACTEARKQDLNECKMEAARAYAALQASDSVRTLREEEYVKPCMENRGYKMQLTSKQCDPQFPFEFQEECWAPSTALGRSIMQAIDGDSPS